MNDSTTPVPVIASAPIAGTRAASPSASCRSPGDWTSGRSCLLAWSTSGTSARLLRPRTSERSAALVSGAALARESATNTTASALSRM